MLRPHGPTIYRSFPLGGVVDDSMVHSRSGRIASACFRTQIKKMMLEGWCFPVFSKVEPNYNPKPLGFMFFFVCQMELKQTQIDTNFLCANRWQVSKKKHGVLWEIMIRQTNAEGFPNTTTVWQNNMWIRENMGTLLETIGRVGSWKMFWILRICNPPLQLSNGPLLPLGIRDVCRHVCWKI